MRNVFLILKSTFFCSSLLSLNYCLFKFLFCFYFTEGPLLGRGSQVRRVRSAHKRASSAKLASDKQRLFKQSYYNGESSSSTCSSDWGRSTPVQLRPQNSSPPPSYSAAINKATVSTTTKSRPRPKTARVNRYI